VNGRGSRCGVQADAAVGRWLLGEVRAGRIAAGQAAGLTRVALDGKVLKGSWEELPDVKVKLFSALVHGEGVIIGQRKKACSILCVSGGPGGLM